MYEIKETPDFSDDNLFLDNKNIDTLNKESCCFKVIRTFKDGEFTEYNLYNNLNEIIETDYKIVNNETNRSGNLQCVNVPYSYWNDYYKELKPPVGKLLPEKITDSIFIKSSLDGTDNSEYIANVTMNAQGCRNLRGVDLEEPTCNINMAINDRIASKKYINKLESCPKEKKIGEMQLIIPVEDCNAMGGKPTAKRGVSSCNFEVCNEVFNKHTLIIPKNKNVEAEACKTYNKTDGYFRVNNKSTCDALKGEYNSQTKQCKKPICYNPTPVKGKLLMGGCRDPDYFGTSFSMKNDNTIRLKNNSNYCISADLDENGKVVENSELNIQECNGNKTGQMFLKQPNGNILYKSSTLGINENVCLTGSVDNTFKLTPCNPTNDYQKWIFTELPKTFCISVGSIVYMLDKTTFRRTPKKFPGSVVNTPVENLLTDGF